MKMTKGSDKEGNFLLLYGSQTGQAKAIAEEFQQTAADKGLSPALYCFSQYEKKFSFEREKYVVIVCSTTGEGEPPETVVKFWRRIKRTTLPADHLSHITYSLLGLGDSNYTNFCNFGKVLDHRLEELGAKRFYPARWADDATGLEIEAEPWMEGVLDSLMGLLTPNVAVSATEDISAPAENYLTNAHTAVTIEQPADDHSVDSVQDHEPTTETSIQPVLNSDHDSSQKAVKNMSNHFTSAQLHSPVTNVSSLDVTSARTEPSDSYIGPPEQRSSVPLSSSNVILKSSLANVEVVTEKEDVDVEESLTHSLPPLSAIPLTIPLCPPRYLKLSFIPDEMLGCPHAIQNACPFPGAQSAISSVPVVSAQQLTRGDDVKKTLELELDISTCSWSYDPGDTIGILCPNDVSEVRSLLNLLGLSEMADATCSLEVLSDTRKRNAAVPEHLPVKSTLFSLLRTCCEIREVPRKALLRSLVDFTSSDLERRRLQELCSKQGAQHYSRFVRQPGICLVDILVAFPTCRPPVEVLLEHLPRLLPRPYSAASSALQSPGRLKIVFNIIEQEAGNGRHCGRRGVCTGWLSDLTMPMRLQSDSVESTLAKLALNDKPVVIDIFRRVNNFFRLPSDHRVPIIMVGPGTGIAPLIGFIVHRAHLMSQLTDSVQFGESWLFYGCRHKEQDFLYREDVEKWEAAAVLTKACVSFSRDSSLPGTPRYVQDSIHLYGSHVAHLIHNCSAVVFVCGDAAGMAPQINVAFKDVLIEHCEMDESAAAGYLTTMRLKKRYLEDVWV